MGISKNSSDKACQFYNPAVYLCKRGGYEIGVTQYQGFLEVPLWIKA
ncbi:hypothetical protein BH10BAC3_BH10BAC3_14200 [soil metagenome]